MLRRLFSKREPEDAATRARGVLEGRFPGVAFGHDVQIIGLDFVRIGEGACVGDRVWINDCLRDHAGRLEIGRFALIGRGGVISTAGRLLIGDFAVLGPDVFVADADHVFADPFQPILQQGVTSGRSVIIEDNCWLGMQAKVFGDLVVGRGSVVAGGSIVRKSVPPFAVVAGAPARIVKLYDFAAKEWQSVRTEAEIEAALARREDHPPPSADAYREVLHRNSRLAPLDRILAGSGLSI